MCDMGLSLMAAALVMSAASMALTEKRNSDNIKRQNEAAQDQKEFNDKAAIENAKQKQQALATQAESAKESAAREHVQSQKMRMTQVGQVVTGAATYGVQGQSIDAAVIGAYQAEDDVRNAIRLNTEADMQNISNQWLANEQNLGMQLAAPAGTMAAGNGLGSAFQFGAQAVDKGAQMYDYYQDNYKTETPSVSDSAVRAGDWGA